MQKILTIAARALEKTPEKMFFFIMAFFSVSIAFKFGFWEAMFFLIFICGTYVYVKKQKFLDKSNERKYKIDKESLRLLGKYLDYRPGAQRKKEDEDD